jgi:hypothetical protein
MDVNRTQRKKQVKRPGTNSEPQTEQVMFPNHSVPALSPPPSALSLTFLYMFPVSATFFKSS